MVSFHVPGHIQPWQRTTGGRHTPKATREFQAKVAMFAKAAGCKPVEGVAIRLVLVFLLPRPKRFCRSYPSRWDLDNAIKSVADGLTGVAYKDDRQVVDITAVKRYTLPREEAGTWVEVRVFREPSPRLARMSGEVPTKSTGTGT